MAVETSSVGLVTEPDMLGLCDPGTNVVLEGIVWHEMENGEWFYLAFYTSYVPSKIK